MWLLRLLWLSQVIADDPQRDAYGREILPTPRIREHPETRDPRRDDDGLTEFVRTEWSETVYKKVRTYSKLTSREEDIMHVANHRRP